MPEEIKRLIFWVVVSILVVILVVLLVLKIKSKYLSKLKCFKIFTAYFSGLLVATASL